MNLSKGIEDFYGENTKLMLDKLAEDFDVMPYLRIKDECAQVGP